MLWIWAWENNCGQVHISRWVIVAIMDVPLGLYACSVLLLYSRVSDKTLPIFALVPRPTRSRDSHPVPPLGSKRRPRSHGSAVCVTQAHPRSPSGWQRNDRWYYCIVTRRRWPGKHWSIMGKHASPAPCAMSKRVADSLCRTLLWANVQRRPGLRRLGRNKHHVMRDHTTWKPERKPTPLRE